MRIKWIMLLAGLLLAACKPEEQKAKEPVKLSVSPEELSFTAEGGEAELIVTAGESPYVTPWDKWIECRKGSYADNKLAVTVKVEKNSEEKERSSKISIVCGDEKVYVEVAQEAADNRPVKDDNAAWAVAEKLGIGWNLGNQMDAHANGVASETCWGNAKATQAALNAVAKAGFKTVRIPVTWLGHIGEAPDYKLDETWLERVAEIVGYAENAGLNAIVNIHHDGADSKYWLNIKEAAGNATRQQEIVAQLSAIWSQIAVRFKDKGDFLMFECCNEIHDGSWGWGANRTDGGAQYRCLNEWNAAFVKAVRATGGKNADRLLGVPAYCTNIDLAIESFVLPEDSAKDKLMLSVHCYDPGDYCLSAKKSQWGHTADTSKKVAGDNEADLKASFEKLFEHFVSKGIPVYLGECGCVNRGNAVEQAFQQYYLSYFARLASLYGVPALLWDNGATGSGNESFGYINHSSGAYCSKGAEEAVKALVSSYNSGESLDAVYDKAPQNK